MAWKARHISRAYIYLIGGAVALLVAAANGPVAGAAIERATLDADILEDSASSSGGGSAMRRVTYIAFTSDRTGSSDIYEMASHGRGGWWRVTRNGNNNSPNWSSDGRYIVYQGERIFEDAYSPYIDQEIFFIDQYGGRERRVTFDEPGDDTVYQGSPDWVPGGLRIAYTANLRSGVTRNFDIYTIEFDGSDERRLTTAAGDETEPDWSPDGTKIAYQYLIGSDWQIYTMNAADGTGRRQITRSPDSDDEAPDWSPDGTKIAYVSDRQIYTMNADGIGPRRQLTTTSSNISPTWSPDGEKIAFSSVRDGNWEIYTMNADGTHQVNVSRSSDSSEGSPSWRPIH